MNFTVIPWNIVYVLSYLLIILTKLPLTLLILPISIIKLIKIKFKMCLIFIVIGIIWGKSILSIPSLFEKWATVFQSKQDTSINEWQQCSWTNVYIITLNLWYRLQYYIWKCGLWRSVAMTPVNIALAITRGDMNLIHVKSKLMIN